MDLGGEAGFTSDYITIRIELTAETGGAMLCVIDSCRLSFWLHMCHHFHSKQKKHFSTLHTCPNKTSISPHLVACRLNGPQVPLQAQAVHLPRAGRVAPDHDLVRPAGTVAAREEGLWLVGRPEMELMEGPSTQGEDLLQHGRLGLTRSS